MGTDTADTPPTVETQRTDPGFGTVGNAVIGGLVGLLVSFVPGSPLIGGAVAGYLEGGDTSSGLYVGELAGLVMFVPYVLFGLLVATLFAGFGGTSMLALVALGLLAVGLYTLGLSAAGALVGVYLRNER